MTAPRENLTRSAPFEQRDDEGDGLTLDGYAAVFGEPTLIDSWEGQFYEQIRKGAFRKSIRERTPVMQFDHGRHPLVGSIPIGRIDTLAEDEHGLTVQGRISDNWLMAPVRDAIRDGAVDGMSFRFSVVREEWRDAAGKLVRLDELEALLWAPGERGPLTRTLIEVKLHELGPVVFPAYEGTSVGVRARSLAAEIRSDDDMRRQLRASLARQAPSAAPADNADDLREVARALLFGSADNATEWARGQPYRWGAVDGAPQTSDAPPAGHPSAPDRTVDAPADEGHPSSTTDAPPSDGHPSPTEPTTSREPLRSEISERIAFMRGHLASIADKDI